MEQFKKLDEILKPDPRTDLFQIYDEDLKDFRNREVSDIHHRLEQIELKEFVPKAIKSHFITSKHLVLYSWFVYRFIPVAEFHAIASLEFALKLKTGKKKWGLRRLLGHAVKKGWVEDNDFSIHRENIKRRKVRTKEMEEFFDMNYENESIPIEGQYTSILMDSLPYLRNEYAHGSNTIAPQSYLTLIICAEFINKIFEA